ncbi:MAG: LacI family DNA-binding transcriptional regulator [Cytophagales bacterium]|nr:LacI family DNA-binding transcriptional regulator [Cytophagales bacterium]
MSEKKITIKDIAKLAQVSAGTVDRVLHKRGKVSESNRKKVEAVLKEINYEPNLIAKTLKNNRIFRLNAIIPSSAQDEYWQKARRGLMAGLKEFKSFGIDIQIIEFDIDRSDSFQSACQQTINQKPDGVLAVPIFHDDAPQQFNAFDEAGLPYMTFNTHLQALNPTCYIGLHHLNSGRLAGQLSLVHCKKPGAMAMIHVNEHPDKADHAREKEDGFKSYLEEQGFDLKDFHSIRLNEGPSFQKALSSALDSIPDLSAVHVSTSKAFLVQNTLKDIHPACTLSGYDLVASNVELLKKHQIQFLIDQKPVEQAYQGVVRFTDLLIFKKPVESEYLLPLNVAFAENIDSMLSTVHAEKIP